MKTYYYLHFVSLLFSISLLGQTNFTVYNDAGLDAAILNSGTGPGTIITLANSGNWANTTLSISKSGTAIAPITIKAETPGSVVFSGNTNVKLGGSYINFEGVVFMNPPATVNIGTPLIDFRVNSSNVGNYCKVTNIKIVNFNQETAAQSSVFKWILLRGHHNEISYSSFLGKHGVGSIINDNRDSPAIENYHKIHHNYFADRTPQGTSVVNENNDQDAIRIGNSSTSLENSFTEIYDNYFYNFVGEIEVISNKSCGNKYYNNTFESYSGALTLRHGNNCEVYNNFFLAKGQSFSGGIRVIGENHKIYNNYIEGTRARYPNNSATSGLSGINIHNGILNSALNEYYQVKNATIVNNTFVNCDLGVRVGATFSAGTQNQPPQDVIIGNNLFLVNTTIANTSSNRAIQVTTQLIESAANLSSYENNIKQTTYAYDSFGAFDGGGNINVAVPPTQPAILTIGTDIYNIVSGSPAIDYAVGTYAFLTEDVIGGTRSIGATFDAGAEEFNGGGTRRPYKQTDLGVNVGFGASNALSVSDNNKFKAGIKIYPNPSKYEVYISSQLGIMQSLKVYDITGKLLLKSEINSSSYKIDVNSLSKGIYVIEIDGFKSRFVVN